MYPSGARWTSYLCTLGKLFPILQDDVKEDNYCTRGLKRTITNPKNEPHKNQNKTVVLPRRVGIESAAQLRESPPMECLYIRKKRTTFLWTKCTPIGQLECNIPVRRNMSSLKKREKPLRLWKKEPLLIYTKHIYNCTKQLLTDKEIKRWRRRGRDQEYFLTVLEQNLNIVY